MKSHQPVFLSTAAPCDDGADIHSNTLGACRLPHHRHQSERSAQLKKFSIRFVRPRRWEHTRLQLPLFSGSISWLQTTTSTPSRSVTSESDSTVSVPNPRSQRDRRGDPQRGREVHPAHDEHAASWPRKRVPFAEWSEARRLSSGSDARPDSHSRKTRGTRDDTDAAGAAMASKRSGHHRADRKVAPIVRADEGEDDWLFASSVAEDEAELPRRDESKKTTPKPRRWRRRIEDWPHESISWPGFWGICKHAEKPDSRTPSSRRPSLTKLAPRDATLKTTPSPSESRPTSVERTCGGDDHAACGVPDRRADAGGRHTAPNPPHTWSRKS